MALTISLPPATEALLAVRAKVVGEAPEQYASRLLTDAIANESNGHSAPQWRRAEELTPAERLAALDGYLAEVRARPPITHLIDDSRDSMYGDPDDRGGQ